MKISISHVTIHQLRRLQLLHVLTLAQTHPYLAKQIYHTKRRVRKKKKSKEKYFTLSGNVNVSLWYASKLFTF